MKTFFSLGLIDFFTIRVTAFYRLKLERITSTQRVGVIK